MKSISRSPVRSQHEPRPWVGGETAAFMERVYDARWMIHRGCSDEEVRAKHGGVVLQKAKEKKSSTLIG